MKYRSVDELKENFFDYFTKTCGHKKISGYSLVPKVDHSVLFTPAGMHPLIPYISGVEKSPEGNRLVNIQNVIRTGAIDRVGLDSFLTFFELFGVWKLDGYSKEDTLKEVWKFLTDEKYLGIPKEKLAMTYFYKDKEILSLWEGIGVNQENLYPSENNWKGPYSKEKICGPNTRVFYDTGKDKCSKNCSPLCSCGKYVELWDVVFFDYKVKDDRRIKSDCPSVDMGAGVERIAALIQNVDTIYETDKFKQIVQTISCLETKEKKVAVDEAIIKRRIVADHLRCATFIIGDEETTLPSSKDRGYVLRKIIRRAINNSDQLGIDRSCYEMIIDKIINIYGKDNPSLIEKRDFIIQNILKEYDVYKDNLKKNLIKLQKVLSDKDNISSAEIKKLFGTYGVPIDMITEMVLENNIKIRS